MTQLSELSEWPTVAEAAAKLGVGERSIERRIAYKEIEARKRPRLGRKPETVCNPQDLARLQPPPFEMPAAATSSALVRAAEKNTATGTPRVAEQDPFRAFDWLIPLATATMAAGESRSREAVIRRFLTLEEASEKSGLSASFLRRACIDRVLRAVKDKRKWKIDRKAFEEDLDKLTGHI